MERIQLYHYLHLVGALLLFTSLGGVLAVAGGVTNVRRLVGILHGMGMLLLVVAGFGWLAKAGGAYPNWVWAKFGIWIVLGMLPMVAKKRWLQPGAVIGLGLMLGASAAYLGYFKPF